MNCLKCGRDTTNNRVFCDSCLSVMELYPVKPDTPVHLPKQKGSGSWKKPAPRKRAIPPEEQILSLKKALRRSRILGLVFLVALSVAAVVLVWEFTGNDIPAIGQNYTINTGMDTD